MTCQRIRRRSAGFTLVELLVVILIISILAGLITAAAIHARTVALNGAMRIEANQLEMALSAYKDQYGDYPPDFFGVDFPAGVPFGDESRAEVVRHLRKAFPSYRPGSVYQKITGNPATGSGFDRFIADLTAAGYLPTINNYSELKPYLNPGTALPFWLGGMPADDASGSSTKLMGFAADPTNPLDNNPSASRKPSLFEFDETRLLCVCDTADEDDYPFYYYVPERPTTDAPPFVYFKPRRSAASGKIEYAVGAGNSLTPLYFEAETVVENPQGGDTNVAVPYLQDAWNRTDRDTFVDTPSDATGAVRKWHKPKGVQIICAGFDGTYGYRPSGNSAQFRFTPSEDRDELVTGSGITWADKESPDYDNLTNFLPGTIEDQMP